MGGTSIKEKMTLLRRADLFSRLMDNDLEILAKYSKYKHFKPGDIIFRPGDISDCLYIIKTGEVLISDRNNEKEIDLARYIPGECFGEMDMMRRKKRDTRAIAQGNTTLLIFPNKQTVYEEAPKKHPEITVRILYKLLAIISRRIRDTENLISLRTPWINEIRRQVFSDQLTGLFHQSFLENELGAFLPYFGKFTSLLLIKPDNLKEINDEYGHDIGDSILRLIAIYILSVLRRDDLGIRYRGSEIAVILPNTKTDQAIGIANDIKKTLYNMDTSHFIDNNKYRLTASIGVATYPTHAKDNVKLTEAASKKMFEARDKGGNCIISA